MISDPVTLLEKEVIPLPNARKERKSINVLLGLPTSFMDVFQVLMDGGGRVTRGRGRGMGRGGEEGEELAASMHMHVSHESNSSRQPNLATMLLKA